MITYHIHEKTPEGLWLSPPQHTRRDGQDGELEIRQCVIGGMVSQPRFAVAETGYFYGFESPGVELTPQKAFALGMLDSEHPVLRLPIGELFNDQLVDEVRFCGYSEYQAAMQASVVSLAISHGAIEHRVLLKLIDWHCRSVPAVYRALLFGLQSKGFTKTELAALVKLVRRGWVRFYRVFVERQGYVLRIEVSPEPEFVTAESSHGIAYGWKSAGAGLSVYGESRDLASREWQQALRDEGRLAA